MSSVVSYKNNDNIISQIKQWSFGSNWPIVYIYYNDKIAYVGETLDAIRRTEQHMQEPEFQEFTDVCFISNKTFNKSVILDLESFLIKYMSADGTHELINCNGGVADHNYFYKEAYEEDFKEIWDILIKMGIVKKSLLDIENSELFKYSPYKTLNAEQQNAAHEILKRIYEINNAGKMSLIKVSGGAGTGKTILAVYLVKLLADIGQSKKVWNYVEEYEEVAKLKKLSEKIAGVKKIGFVVPMVELRTTMQKIFDSIEGLSSNMVLAPEQVVNDYYDLLVVDEAHRLYQRKHLPGSHIYLKFDKINQQLMGDNFTKSENDLTELDWIIKSSRMQVLFYDRLQSIRTADIDHNRFDLICKPHLYKYIELFSQMRCKGGNGYYEYIKKIITSVNLSHKEYCQIDNYTLQVVDSVSELFEIINNQEPRELCKVVTGPGWGIEEKIVIDGNVYHWSGERKEKEKYSSDNSVLSIHKSQGFDLNYAGVIFGKEVIYDKEKKCIEINKNELKDNFTKSNGDEAMRQYILNIYLTLLTRGIKGTYIYAIDENLREYLKQFI